MKLQKYRFATSVGFVFLASFANWAAPQAVGQSVFDRIGYTQLQAEYGAELAALDGVEVAIVEAPNGAGNYLPNLASSQFTGKTINNLGSGSTGVSSHANSVGVRFFGNTSSTSPNVTDVDSYDAGTWLTNALSLSTGGTPISQSYAVSNHSYILNLADDNPDTAVDETFDLADATNVLQRLDYYINSNDTTVVVGTRNGASTSLSVGLTPSYNSISVGSSTANTVSGVTTFYGAGRTKVDIVAPEGSSSNSTPRVSSAAALLHDAGSGDAVRNQVIKATLMAGATKDVGELTAPAGGTWDRTTTRPLDDDYGAGELNVYNSYKIQEGGEFDGSSTAGGTTIGEFGWDYDGSFAIGDTSFYDFVVGEAELLEELSVILSWNIDVNDDSPSPLFDPSTQLADFNLSLLDVGTGLVIDSSESAVDNVEHIYFQDLAAGTYRLRVERNASNDEKAAESEAYGLAWRFTTVTAVPEPGSSTFLVFALGAIFSTRRRK